MDPGACEVPVCELLLHRRGNVVVPAALGLDYHGDRLCVLDKRPTGAKTWMSILSPRPLPVGFGRTSRPDPYEGLPPTNSEPPDGGGSGGNDCQGYDPCITPGADVDCAGGSGNGPRYVDGPVYVNGSDPYGLDSNYDGVGCEQ
jgi:hypothetical protein